MEKLSGPHPRLLLTRTYHPFSYLAYGSTSTCLLQVHHTEDWQALLVLRDLRENTGVPLFRSKAEAYLQACRTLADVLPDPREVQVVMVNRCGMKVRVQCQEDVFGGVLDLTEHPLPLGVDDTDVQRAFLSGTLQHPPCPEQLQWVVYQNLSGFEGLYVAQGFLVDTEVRHTLYKRVSPSLESVREVIPPHLQRSGRSLGDSVHVLETWVQGR